VGRDSAGAIGKCSRADRVLCEALTPPTVALMLGHASAESAVPALVSYRSVAASDLGTSSAATKPQTVEPAISACRDTCSVPRLRLRGGIWSGIAAGPGLQKPSRTQFHVTRRLTGTVTMHVMCRCGQTGDMDDRSRSPCHNRKMICCSNTTLLHKPWP
jgi:hypothetical protein